MVTPPALAPALADWPLLLQLLDQALALPEAGRQAWLDALATPNDRLKPTLQQMLHDRAAMESSAFLQATPTLPKALAEDFFVGEVIGPYRLVRLLGHGGMADVWLGERADGVHRRPVALKLPLPGRHRRITAGFLQECQLLSQLTHPNIASVLDAGSDADQPWLALEFVDGLAIDRHCRQAQLDVPARLRLFLQVLRAVQHAHAQLVIHRDIKPGNVLVDGTGQVKLLDFGVAKLMAQERPTLPGLPDEGSNAEAAPTLWGGRAMTPEYASPEQIQGLPVGTASDIYSLGSVLFELLVGRRLQAGATPTALEHATLHDEPPRPSRLARSDPQAKLPGIAPQRLARQLAGDLDLIVSKALRKAPEQRYATVAAFAEDIERHLQQRPILARPDSLSHQLGRFAARNRWAVAASGVLGLVLAGGIASSLWQARLARLEGERAKAAMSFLTNLFDNSARRGSGARPAHEVTGKELLQAGVERLRTEFGQRNALRLDLLNMLGKVGEEMDLLELVTPLHEEAVGLAHELFGERHLLYAQALLTRAESTLRSGDFERTLAQGQAALSLLQSQHPSAHEDLAQAHILLGNAHDQLNKAREASQAHLQAGLKLLQSSGSVTENRSRAAFYLARSFEAHGDLAGAEKLYLDGLQAARQNFGANSYIVAFGEQNYGDLLRQQARFDEAGEHLRTALAVYSAVLGPKHLSVAGIHYNLGQVLAAQGQRSAADAAYVQAIAVSDEVAGAYHRNYGGYFRVTRAQLLLDMGRLAEAREVYEAWLAHWPAGSPERGRLIRFLGLGYSRALIADRQWPRVVEVLAEVEAALQPAGAAGLSPRAQIQRQQWQARRAEYMLASDQSGPALALLAGALAPPLQAPLGDLTGALALLSALVQSQPDAASAQAALQGFAALGDSAAWARSDVERQAQLDVTLGRLQIAAGQATPGRAALLRALALRERIDAPGSPWLAQVRQTTNLAAKPATNPTTNQAIPQR